MVRASHTVVVINRFLDVQNIKEVVQNVLVRRKGCRDSTRFNAGLSPAHLQGASEPHKYLVDFFKYSHKMRMSDVAGHGAGIWQSFLFKITSLRTSRMFGNAWRSAIWGKCFEIVRASSGSSLTDTVYFACWLCVLSLPFPLPFEFLLFVFFVFCAAASAGVDPS
jgi:hypothetical protein